MAINEKILHDVILEILLTNDFFWLRALNICHPMTFHTPSDLLCFVDFSHAGFA
jgi:hypothetical protein